MCHPLSHTLLVSKCMWKSLSPCKSPQMKLFRIRNFNYILCKYLQFSCVYCVASSASCRTHYLLHLCILKCTLWDCVSSQDSNKPFIYCLSCHTDKHFGNRFKTLAMISMDYSTDLLFLFGNRVGDEYICAESRLCYLFVWEHGFFVSNFPFVSVTDSVVVVFVGFSVAHSLFLSDMW